MLSAHDLERMPAVPSQRAPARRTVARALLFFEAATFALAAAIHRGMLLDGHRHAEAATAETVIALVLLAGLVLTFLPQPWPPRVEVAVQAFALVGVLIGLVSIAVGVGPRTVADVAYHLAILAVLAVGLAVSARNARGGAPWARH